jgi:hypothetical protein
MMRPKILFIFAALIALASATGATGSPGATDPKLSVLAMQLTSLRYYAGLDLTAIGLDAGLAGEPLDDDADFRDGDRKAPGKKSPTKAFLLSIAVPGAGQWYYGSKTKALIFFGAEVATWALYFNYHSDGIRREDEFIAFNHDHWSRDAYEQKYLYNAYPDYRQDPDVGYVDDEWVTETEVSHHLPDTRTQQYYEMTGKYDQFSWGWDDAMLNGLSLDSLIALGTLEPVNELPSRPSSANRDKYEVMRDEANNAFSKANNMIIVGIVNRLISGFEAYFTTKAHQSGNSNTFGAALERVKVRADLKTFNTKRDTPFVTVAVKF